MFIQSIHTHCNTEAVMEAVRRKVVADQPIHQGAWQTLKNTTPEVFACAIMQFVPDHVQEVLSLTPEELTLERIQQLPRVTRSDKKSWGAYLHILNPGNEAPVGLYVGSSVAERHGVWARTRTHEGKIRSRRLESLHYRFAAQHGGTIGTFHQLAIFRRDKPPLACLVRLTEGLLAVYLSTICPHPTTNHKFHGVAVTSFNNAVRGGGVPNIPNFGENASTVPLSGCSPLKQGIKQVIFLGRIENAVLRARLWPSFLVITEDRESSPCCLVGARRPRHLPRPQSGLQRP